MLSFHTVYLSTVSNFFLEKNQKRKREGKKAHLSFFEGCTCAALYILQLFGANDEPKTTCFLRSRKKVQMAKCEKEPFSCFQHSEQRVPFGPKDKYANHSCHGAKMAED